MRLRRKKLNKPDWKVGKKEYMSVAVKAVLSVLKLVVPWVVY